MDVRARILEAEAELIEARSANGSIHRRDFYISAPATTNNRMALASAIAALQLLSRKGARLRVLIVSDSRVPGKGHARVGAGLGGTRMEATRTGRSRISSSGKALVASARLHDVQWTWVRGHKGHPKNEYANDLAVFAAREQRTSEGIVESGFDDWLQAKRAKGLYLDYDPDAAFAELEERLLSDDPFALSEGR